MAVQAARLASLVLAGLFRDVYKRQDLVRTTLDTIMRVLVVGRENEQSLLRRGLVPARSLPRAEQSRPNFVALTYQRHAQG